MSRRIVWDGDNGAADGATVYTLHSEQVRGEPRSYWVVTPDGREVPPAFYGLGWPTRDRAKAAAERHHRTMTP